LFLKYITGRDDDEQQQQSCVGTEGMRERESGKFLKRKIHFKLPKKKETPPYAALCSAGREVQASAYANSL
jgi:hypothetical protein